ncbi:hypothetical protein AK830_g654 [Neonectria ditissima]|uniref:Uncharacterized protein n=1 Tax=Neonectria ditissima TaxID=78410 RepID=A0A0P7BVX5_9HYPO|nr:hypothetical protein AK830_g654 [Neonectria ditissima]
MPSSIITSLLLPRFDTTPLMAAVLGVDTTATTYLLNCPWDEADFEESSSCGVYNNTVTVGPWASKTLPPGTAETGVFDLSVDRSRYLPPWEFSIHCKMSRTVAQECTTIDLGGNSDVIPTATLTSPDSLKDQDLFRFSHTPITITAGLELLAATHSPSSKPYITDDVFSSSQSSAGEFAIEESSSSHSGLETPSSAVPCLVGVFAAVSVAGIAAAMVLS